MLIQIVNTLFQLAGRLYSMMKISKYSDYFNLTMETQLKRMPDEVLGSSSKGVRKNARFLAGYVQFLQVREKQIDIIVTYRKREVLDNMTAAGSSGIDIYSIHNNQYKWEVCMVPKHKNGMYMRKTVKFERKDYKIALFWPSFAEISHILIKQSEAKIVREKIDTKGTVAIYGSSITQGCAAGRPGLNYGNLLRIKYGYDVTNFGFSESAQGETNIIEYISQQSTDVIVLEYDHNATVERLKKTYERVYRTIRKNNKNALIIMISRISGGISITENEEDKRYRIIKDVYQNALLSNDKRIVFIRGKDLISLDAKKYLADDRHPNDKGMELLADSIYNELHKFGV